MHYCILETVDAREMLIMAPSAEACAAWVQHLKRFLDYKHSQKAVCDNLPRQEIVMSEYHWCIHSGLRSVFMNWFCR